jgi:hypothetical protein
MYGMRWHGMAWATARRRRRRSSTVAAARRRRRCPLSLTLSSLTAAVVPAPPPRHAAAHKKVEHSLPSWRKKAQPHSASPLQPSSRCARPNGRHAAAKTYGGRAAPLPSPSPSRLNRKPGPKAWTESLDRKPGPGIEPRIDRIAIRGDNRCVICCIVSRTRIFDIYTRGCSCDAADR